MSQKNCMAALDVFSALEDSGQANLPEISAEDYLRAKFVIDEKDRVLAVCDALTRGDYETVGQKMYETNRGLSKEYAVSCEELDYLNDLAKECGLTGSRIMGGGFGGCTINLVKKELKNDFVEKAKRKFREKCGHEPKVYDVVISDGAQGGIKDGCQKDNPYFRRCRLYWNPYGCGVD